MNLFRGKLALLVFGMSLISPTVFAQADKQGLSAKQLEIIRTVQSADGYIDQKIHDEFWDSMPEFMRRADGQKYLTKLFAQVGEARQNFMLQSWLSTKASLDARQVVRTQGYLDAKAEALGASDNPGYQSKIRESIGSAERMLSAAASGEPLDVHGTKTFLTLDLIDHVLASIQASESRVAKLINPTWEEHLSKFDYPEAHVSILAATPFVVEHQRLTKPGGGQGDMVMLTQSRGDSKYLMIGFSQTAGHLGDPAKSVASVARAAMAGAGVVGREPAVLQWQGRVSATATGTAVTSEGTVFMSIRAVELSQFNGVLQFVAVSNLSAADAIILRGTLEDSADIKLR